MAAGQQSVDDVVEQLCRWQQKHKLRTEQVEELLRWLRKVRGNQSFAVTVAAIQGSYKRRKDNEA